MLHNTVHRPKYMFTQNSRIIGYYEISAFASVSLAYYCGIMTSHEKAMSIVSSFIVKNQSRKSYLMNKKYSMFASAQKLFTVKNFHQKVNKYQ